LTAAEQARRIGPMPRTLGLCVTSATTEVPVYNQTYNEPTSGAQRSLKSASANDAAAGTGIRSVRIIYYTLASDGTIRGPFTEVVVMNGTSAVATVATDIALIERLEAVTVGSGGKAAGAITLYANNSGGSTAIAVLSQDDVQTFLAHHYVATGKQCHITDVAVFGGDAASCRVGMMKKTSPFAAAPSLFFAGPFASNTALPALAPLPDERHSPIPGPARVRLQVTPANNNAQLTIGAFGWYDEQAG
jgi:hypothetical protein